MSCLMKRLALSSLALGTLALGARATIVVDIAGGGDFTSLADAIAAAADGEQILVKAGTYLPPAPGGHAFFIDGKGLSIVAEAGATVVIPSLKVTAPPPGHWVILRGLTLDATVVEGSNFEGTLRVDGPMTSVWAEDCTIRGDDGQILLLFGAFLQGPTPAVWVNSDANLTLHRCTLTGGTGFDSGSWLADKWNASAGAVGVLVNGGTAALHDCTVTGGNAGNGSHPFAPTFFAPDGGDGAWVNAPGLLHLSGCHVTGGSNGSNNQVTDDKAGDGVHSESSVAQVWIRDSLLQPGVVAPTGVPGVPVFAANVTSFTAPARSIAVTSPLREGQLGTLHVEGQPGDQVLVLVALGAGSLPMAGKQGVFVLDPSVLLLPLPLGAVPAGGVLDVPFVTPELNPVLEGLTVPLQLVIVKGGTVTLEGGTALAWLDSSL